MRWLTPASADGEGCWLTPDESGERSAFSSKGKGIPSPPACLPACRARPFFRRPVCWTAYREFLTGQGGFCRLLPELIPAARRAVGTAVPGHTERAPGSHPLPREQPLVAAGAAEQTPSTTSPSGELTHRKRPGLMSKLVNFPDDGAEEAEAAHRSPWTPPAHQCEPAAATGLSWEGHTAPPGHPQTLPGPEAAP